MCTLCHDLKKGKCCRTVKFDFPYHTYFFSRLLIRAPNVIIESACSNLGAQVRYGTRMTYSYGTPSAAKRCIRLYTVLNNSVGPSDFENFLQPKVGSRIPICLPMAVMMLPGAFAGRRSPWAECSVPSRPWRLCGSGGHTLPSATQTT